MAAPGHVQPFPPRPNGASGHTWHRPWARTGELGAALEHLAAAALVLGRRHGLEHTSWWARINVLTRGRLLTMAPAG